MWRCANLYMLQWPSITMENWAGKTMVICLSVCSLRRVSWHRRTARQSLAQPFLQAICFDSGRPATKTAIP